MGIFHVKKGTPVLKALPDKTKLKDGASICLDFCCHERKCKYPHALCKDSKHYTNWRNVADVDKAILLSHMNDTGLLWFDEDTMKKHKAEIPSEYSHLLSNATGPKLKQAMKRVDDHADHWIKFHDSINPLVSSQVTICIRHESAESFSWHQQECNPCKLPRLLYQKRNPWSSHY